MGTLRHSSLVRPEMTSQTRFSLNALPFVVALFLLLAVPRIEHFLFPVVKDFVVTGMVKEPDAVTINGYMHKDRDCNFVGVQTVSISNGIEVDAPLIFLDAKNNNDTRPKGTQGWGPWQITVKVSSADAIKLTSTHRCHPFWATDTVLATIPLREY